MRPGRSSGASCWRWAGRGMFLAVVFGLAPMDAAEPAGGARRPSYQADRIDSGWDSASSNGFTFAELEAMDGPAPAFRIPLGQTGAQATRRQYVDPNARLASHRAPVAIPRAYPKAPLSTPASEAVVVEKRAIPRAYVPAPETAAIPHSVMPSANERAIQPVAGGGKDEQKQVEVAEATLPELVAPPAAPVVVEVPAETTDLELPAPVTVTSPVEPTNELELPAQVHKESASFISEPLPTEKLACPTVIYTSSTVTLGVPGELSERGIVAVILRGASESVRGKEYRAGMGAGNGVVRGLESGAYDVSYVDGQNQPIADREGYGRRLIVELEKDPTVAWNDPVELPRQETASANITASVSAKDLAKVEEARALLERGATFSALSAFEKIVVDRLPRVKQGTTGDVVDFTRLFEEGGELVARLETGTEASASLAKECARQLGHPRALAACLYEFGRSYEKAEGEKRPVVPHAGVLAKFCWQVAHELDPTLVGPMRDLAIRLIDERRSEEALVALEVAVRTAPDAEAHFLLGQWHARAGEARQAADAYRRSIKQDPYFLPACFELTRLEVEGSAGAVYGVEVRDLVMRLSDFSGCDLLSSDDREWAARQLDRLSWLAHEADQNQASFAARHWIPRHVRWLPSSGARGKALGVAMANGPRRRIPRAAGARPGVMAAAAARQIPRAGESPAAQSSILPTAGTTTGPEPVVRAIEPNTVGRKEIPIAYPRSPRGLGETGMSAGMSADQRPPMPTVPAPPVAHGDGAVR